MNNKIVNKVSLLIMSDYNQKKGIFATTDELLEMQCPDGIEYSSEEHANFYFFLIFNDHGTKSINLYSRFKKLYIKSPEIFNPNYIVQNYINNEKDLLNNYLINLGLRYPTKATTSWINNSKLLIKDFQGKSINLYKSTNDALELYNKIMNFISYGPKTSGLLLRVIIGVGFNRNLTNVENVPLPVDIHDSRIAYNCNIYKPNKINDLQKIYSNPFHIKKIEKIWRDSALNINVKWEDLDRALWLLGSKGCVSKQCNICPIKEFCSIGKEYINDKNLFSN